MGKPEPLPCENETTSAQEEAKSKEPRKRKTKSELYPKNLPVVEKTTLIPPEVQADRDAYKLTGERYHDELDYQPARLQRERTRKQNPRHHDHPSSGNSPYHRQTL